MAGAKSMLTSQAETPKSAKSRSSSQSMKLKSGKSGSKWESELLEVCGKTLSISHPSLEPGTATSEYKISSSKIPLQDDTTLVLDGNGTVSASPSGDHTVFTAMGGHVDFRPKNLNRGKGSAELATANIVFSKPESKSLTEDVSQSDAPLIPEISAYLKTPLVISPRRGFKLELGQGEFTKRANDPNPKFKFWDTKLTYNDVPITGSFETESDQTGLHLSNPDRIWVERSNVDHMKKLPTELGDYSYLVLNETGFRLEDDTAGDELRSQSRAKIGNLGALAAQEGAARDLAAGAAAASAADARARLKAETANQAFKDKTAALNYAGKDIAKLVAEKAAARNLSAGAAAAKAADDRTRRNAETAKLAFEDKTAALNYAGRDIAKLAAQRGAARNLNAGAAATKAADDRARLNAETAKLAFEDKTAALNYAGRDIAKLAAQRGAARNLSAGAAAAKAADDRARRNAETAKLAFEDKTAALNYAGRDIAKLAAQRGAARNLNAGAAATKAADDRARLNAETAKLAFEDKTAALNYAGKDMANAAAATGKTRTKHSSLEIQIGSNKFTLLNAYTWGDRINSAELATGYRNGFEIVLKNVKVLNNSELIGTAQSISPLNGSKFTVQCEKIHINANGNPRTSNAVLSDEFKTYELDDVIFLPGNVVSAVEAHCSIDGYKGTFYGAKYATVGYMTYELATLATVVDYGRDLEEEEKAAKKAEKAKKKAEKQAIKAAKKGKQPDKDTGSDAAKASDTVDEPFFVFKLDAGSLVKGGFQQGVSSLNIAGHQRSKEIEITQKGSPNNTSSTTKIDKDIFTRDGFAQLENATFLFKTDSNKSSSISGEGSFRFQPIPYRIALSDGSIISGSTQKKEDPEEDSAEFTITPSGDLDADVGDGIELSLLAGDNGTESRIYSVVLDGVSVKGGYLKAKGLRLYNGIKAGINLDDYSEDDTLKDLLSADITISAAHITPEDKSPIITPSGGLTADTSNQKKKAHAGRFGVSNFLGYLSADVDYPAGKIDAELSHEEEKEGEGKSLTKIFKKKQGSGVNAEVPIVPFLMFTMGITPLVSYGGSLSAHLDRHKSFGEKLDIGENMDLGGGFKLGGSVGIGLSAGVSAGVPYIISAGVELNGDAKAEVETGMEAKTSIAKQQDKKFGQSAPLTAEGSLKTTLSMSLSFCGTVGLLIWKANVYELEIASKSVELKPIAFTLSKAPNSGGVLSGWNIDQIDLSADAFGKEAQLAIKKEITEADPLLKAKEELAISQEAVDILGADVGDTWKALEDMKNKAADRGYVIDPKDKAQLEEKIKALTETAEAKLKHQEEVLTTHLLKLEAVKTLTQADLTKTEAELKECQHRASLWDNVADLAKTGGFGGTEQYQTTDTKDLKGSEKKAADAANRETNKKALVDLNIATILGMYDLTFDAAKAEVAKVLKEYNEKNMGSEEFYYKLNVDVSSLSLEDFKKQRFIGELPNSKSNREYTGLQMLQHLTTIQNNHNYYDILSQPILKNLSQADADYVRGRFGKNYRKVFRKKLHPDDPNSKETYFDTEMTGYEFLKCIQTNTYPKNAASKAGEDRSGQPIENTTAAEKQQALDWLVHDYGADVYISSNGIVAEGSNISAETAVQQSFTHLTQSLFGTSPEALVKSKNFDLTKNVAALQDKVDEAKAKNTAAEQKYKEASQAVEACNKDIEQCRQRLAQLTTNVSAGTQVNQDGAAAKAAAAVDYIQKDHKKIDSLSTSVNKVVGAPSSLDAFKKLDGLKLPSKPVNKEQGASK